MCCFSGNEADYVIVSVVRSSRAGFLNSLNRLNVLLTRCRKGLVIVSNRKFLGFSGEGSRTLLGKLVAYYRSQYSSCDWTDWRSVATASVNLPGVLAPNNVASLHHRGFSSYPIPISVSVNMQPTPYHLPTYDFLDAIAFPPLAPKMPLLKGSWANSVLKPLHPLSHVHRRENSNRNNGSIIHQTKSQRFIYSPQTMMNTSKSQNEFHNYRERPQFSVRDGNIPRGTNHNNTTQVQRPYLERVRAQTLASQQAKNTKTRKMGKTGTKSTRDFEEQKPKSLTRKSETTMNSGGFIRSVVVHSRPS
jgi:hypothetical protein